MVDDRLRELERRFRGTGAVEDEAAWLRERLRVGELAPERLDLAADLGHRASQAARGRSAGAPAREELAGILTRRGKEVCARAAVAVVRDAAPALGGAPRAVLAALEDAEQWIVCPCVEHLSRAAGHWWQFRTADTTLGWLAAQVACVAGYDPEGWAEPSTPEELEELLAYSLGYMPGFLETAGELEGVVQAAASELVPWALGHEDPVRDRVEARAQA